MINDIKVIDNFYSNPDAIVEVLSGDYPITGCGTGKRSVGLQEISPALYEQFCRAIYALHGLNGENLHIFTFFMEHQYNPIDVFNHNWVHIDGKNPDACRMITEDYKLLVCGQIFMTPDPDPEADIEICRVRPELNWSRQELIDKTINDYTNPREDLHAGKITQQQFEQLHDEYHANFETTCTIKNYYNRMVSWKAGTLHGARMTNKMQKRLTQFFFVQSLGPLDTWPGETYPIVHV
jgi:hypothetical protein